MKPGDTFASTNKQMLEPLVGRIVDVQVGDEVVTARLVEVDDFNTILKVVPEGTRD